MTQVREASHLERGRNDIARPADEGGQGAATRFDAFISYSHAGDRELARALQKLLESFSRPLFRLRSMRVYRDETNLDANPDLWGAIQLAVEQSRYFVLLASPESAASKWVQRELTSFVTARGAQYVCVILARGVSPWTEKAPPEDVLSREDCAVSRTTYELLHDVAVEPVVVDLSKNAMPQQRRRDVFQARQSAAASVAARIFNRDKDELYGEHISRQRRVLVTGLVLLIVTLLAIQFGIGWRRASLSAAIKEHEAELQRLVAELREAITQVEAFRFSNRAHYAGEAAPIVALAHTRRNAVPHPAVAVGQEKFIDDAERVIADEVSSLSNTLLERLYVPIPRPTSLPGTWHDIHFSEDDSEIRARPAGSGAWYSWNIATLHQRPLSTNSEQPGKLIMAASRDGAWQLVSASDPGGNKLFVESGFDHSERPLPDLPLIQTDLASPARLARLELEFAGSSIRARFSPNGRLLAAYLKDNVVRLWDLRSGELLRRYPVEGPCEIEFSPSGAWLGLGCLDGARLINMKSIQLQRINGNGRRVQFCTDESYALVPENRGLGFVALNDELPAKTKLLPLAPGAVWQVGFACHSRHLAAVEAPLEPLLLLNPDAPGFGARLAAPLTEPPPSGDRVERLHFSTNGKFLVSLRSIQVAVHDVANGGLVAQFLHAALSDSAISHDGRWLALGAVQALEGSSPAIRPVIVYDLATSPSFARPWLPTERAFGFENVSDVHLAANGSRVFSTRAFVKAPAPPVYYIQAASLKDGEVFHCMLPAPARALAVSGNGNRAAAYHPPLGNQSASVSLWQAERGGGHHLEPGALQLPCSPGMTKVSTGILPNAGSNISLSPTGDRLAIDEASRERPQAWPDTVIYDTSTWQPVARLAGAMNAEFSPVDSSKLAAVFPNVVAGDLEDMRVVTMAGEVLCEVQTFHWPPFASMRWALDGRHIAVGHGTSSGTLGDVMVYDVEQCREAFRLPHPTSMFALSEDGGHLVAAQTEDSDRWFELWDTKRGTRLSRQRAGLASVDDFVVSGNGYSIAVGGRNGLLETLEFNRDNTTARIAHLLQTTNIRLCKGDVRHPVLVSLPHNGFDVEPAECGIPLR